MHLVVVSTYPPRRCGLATFTADLRGALATSAAHWQVEVCAVDRDALAYPPEVVHVLPQDHRRAYRTAARALAARRPDLVVIQHEYGIFGGPDGDHVVELADELRALGQPYVVTPHTVLSAPRPGQRATLTELCRAATRVTCFTDTARRIAATTGMADLARTVVVPHGVPVVLGDPDGARPGPALRRALATPSGPVLSTFGLLRPGKSLETAIAALPAVVRRHPGLRYVIAGATHPETLRTSGESYRQGLAALAHELGVAGQVRFVDAFLSERELAVLLARTRLYLTPYRSPHQTCSGALTFALAAGCPVVSTAYPYAVDLLAPRGGPARGVLVPFDDPDAFATAVTDLLAHPPRLAAARAAARELGAGLTWPAVAARFAAVFAAAAAAPPPAPGAPPRRPGHRPASVEIGT
jgi:glycosyltransferase involved in cell wall biosynthesis